MLFAMASPRAPSPLQCRGTFTPSPSPYSALATHEALGGSAGRRHSSSRAVSATSLLRAPILSPDLVRGEPRSADPDLAGNQRHGESSGSASRATRGSPPSIRLDGLPLALQDRVALQAASLQQHCGVDLPEDVDRVVQAAFGRLELRVRGLEGRGAGGDRRVAELSGLVQALTEEQRALLIRLDRLEEHLRSFGGPWSGSREVHSSPRLEDCLRRLQRLERERRAGALGLRLVLAVFEEAQQKHNRQWQALEERLRPRLGPLLRETRLPERGSSQALHEPRGGGASRGGACPPAHGHLSAEWASGAELNAEEAHGYAQHAGHADTPPPPPGRLERLRARLEAVLLASATPGDDDCHTSGWTVARHSAPGTASIWESPSPRGSGSAACPWPRVQALEATTEVLSEAIRDLRAKLQSSGDSPTFGTPSGSNSRTYREVMQRVQANEAALSQILARLDTPAPAPALPREALHVVEAQAEAIVELRAQLQRLSASSWPGRAELPELEVPRLDELSEHIKALAELRSQVQQMVDSSASQDKLAQECTAACSAELRALALRVDALPSPEAFGQLRVRVDACVSVDDLQTGLQELRLQCDSFVCKDHLEVALASMRSRLESLARESDSPPWRIQQPPEEVAFAADVKETLAKLQARLEATPLRAQWDKQLAELRATQHGFRESLSDLKAKLSSLEPWRVSDAELQLRAGESEAIGQLHKANAELQMRLADMASKQDVQRQFTEWQQRSDGVCTLGQLGGAVSDINAKLDDKVPKSQLAAELADLKAHTTRLERLTVELQSQVQAAVAKEALDASIQELRSSIHSLSSGDKALGGEVRPQVREAAANANREWEAAEAELREASAACSRTCSEVQAELQAVSRQLAAWQAANAETQSHLAGCVGREEYEARLSSLSSSIGEPPSRQQWTATETAVDDLKAACQQWKADVELQVAGLVSKMEIQNKEAQGDATGSLAAKSWEQTSSEWQARLDAIVRDVQSRASLADMQVLKDACVSKELLQSTEESWRSLFQGCESLHRDMVTKEQWQQALADLSSQLDKFVPREEFRECVAQAANNQQALADLSSQLHIVSISGQKQEANIAEIQSHLSHLVKEEVQKISEELNSRIAALVPKEEWQKNADDIQLRLSRLDGAVPSEMWLARKQETDAAIAGVLESVTTLRTRVEGDVQCRLASMVTREEWQADKSSVEARMGAFVFKEDWDRSLLEMRSCLDSVLLRDQWQADHRALQTRLDELASEGHKEKLAQLQTLLEGRVSKETLEESLAETRDQWQARLVEVHGKLDASLAKEPWQSAVFDVRQRLEELLSKQPWVQSFDKVQARLEDFSTKSQWEETVRDLRSHFEPWLASFADLRARLEEFLSKDTVAAAVAELQSYIDGVGTVKAADLQASLAELSTSLQAEVRCREERWEATAAELQARLDQVATGLQAASGTADSEERLTVGRWERSVADLHAKIEELEASLRRQGASREEGRQSSATVVDLQSRLYEVFSQENWEANVADLRSSLPGPPWQAAVEELRTRLAGIPTREEWRAAVAEMRQRAQEVPGWASARGSDGAAAALHEVRALRDRLEVHAEEIMELRRCVLPLGPDRLGGAALGPPIWSAGLVACSPAEPGALDASFSEGGGGAGVGIAARDTARAIVLVPLGGAVEDLAAQMRDLRSRLLTLSETVDQRVMVAVWQVEKDLPEVHGKVDRLLGELPERITRLEEGEVRLTTALTRLSTQEQKVQGCMDRLEKLPTLNQVRALWREELRVALDDADLPRLARTSRLHAQALEEQADFLQALCDRLAFGFGAAWADMNPSGATLPGRPRPPLQCIGQALNLSARGPREEPDRGCQ